MSLLVHWFKLQKCQNERGVAQISGVHSLWAAAEPKWGISGNGMERKNTCRRRNKENLPKKKKSNWIAHISGRDLFFTPSLVEVGIRYLFSVAQCTIFYVTMPFKLKPVTPITQISKRRRNWIHSYTRSGLTQFGSFRFSEAPALIFWHSPREWRVICVQKKKCTQWWEILSEKHSSTSATRSN